MVIKFRTLTEHSVDIVSCVDSMIIISTDAQDRCMKVMICMICMISMIRHQVRENLL